MPVVLKPTSVIKARLGLNEDGRVQKFMTETCYKHMDKYVPRRDDNLRKNVSMEKDSITYESPYARYQFYGEREDGSHKVVNYTTAGTGTHWDKRMVSAEMDKVVKEVQNFINKGGKE